MKSIIVLIFLLFFSINSDQINPQTQPDVKLLKYYSSLLTINLNYAMDASRVLYHLSKDQKFSKELLETVLYRIEKEVEYANTNIANIVINVSESDKKGIEQSLKNIDKHLAQVSLEIKEVREGIANSELVSDHLSNIYYQILSAEQDDHQAIKKILNLKSDEEPLLVIPEKIK